MSNELHLHAPENLPFVEYTRDFDHAVNDVFRAHVEAQLLAQWLGPRELSMEVDHFDVRTGGSYGYRHVDPEGNSYGFSGSYHSVRENELIIQTTEFDGFPDDVTLEAQRFEDLGEERCRLSGQMVFQSVEGRDGMVASGMEQGLAEGYEKIDELIASER
ncbi:polyketide cyclase [Glutamicibacter sp. BW78]|uniref:SRPBCC family protein n=1 Tax=Glutamicibacter sp. BW78 TaxID=2024403 RepID=UPI000BB93BFA|nr:SRPBCC family protein [Glutamicibacter sp. BW78]PCC24761.1 polyketide cyclase [Glutamicibacter sp. BW78]